MRFFSLGIIVISIFFIPTGTNTEIEENYFVYPTASTSDTDEGNGITLNPIINNSPDLLVEEVSKGLNFPTSMAFLGLDDVLVLEKNEGSVKRVINGELLEEPLLDVNVANEAERGMLGIAVSKNASADKTYVFLYYTEAEGSDGGEAMGNRLYKYELDDNNEELVNPELLLDLPVSPDPTHNGGKIVIGPDDNRLYLTIGDVGDHDASDPSNVINAKGGPEADGRAGILRVTQDGKVVEGPGILGDEHPLDMYYAYGIRNSFGMDFDPVTGNLWDVETGRYFGEEINLVEPGFNSGWMKAQGIWELDKRRRAEGIASPEDESFISQLVDFNGKGKYSSPEFTWGRMPVTTSGAAFFHSDRLGAQYENDLFVGDFVNGMIFDFDLSADRTQLSFNNKGPLQDKLADSAEELKEVIFGYGFGGITDIKTGPDGYLYILSLDRGGDECKPQYPDRACIPYSSWVEGHIFRISPASRVRLVEEKWH